MNIHPKAKTTPAIRAEIQSSNLSQRKLAEKYNVTRTTIQKWQCRDSTGDYSHRPHKLNTTLSEAQKAFKDCEPGFIHICQVSRVHKPFS